MADEQRGNPKNWGNKKKLGQGKVFLGESRHPEANPGISHAARYILDHQGDAWGGLRVSFVLILPPKDKKSCLISSQRPHIYLIHILENIVEDCTRAQLRASPHGCFARVQRVFYFYGPPIRAEDDARLACSPGRIRLETSIRDRHLDQDCLYSL